ncbi:hypothetical protein ALC62_11181, partial [Cyphomyrmex costatus]
LAGRTALFARRAPLRLARRLWGFGGESAVTSRNAVAPPTGMQWAGILLRFTIGHATDI